MSAFRRSLLLSLAVAVATPAAAQFGSQTLGYQWWKAVKDENPTNLNKIANDRSKLNAAVLDYQSDGEGAIHIAVKAGNGEYLRFMLRLGANPDLQSERGGETPLIKAVRFNRYDLVLELLQRGADPDKTDYTGKSARAYAIANTRFPQIAKALADAPKRTAKPVAGPRLN